MRDQATTMSAPRPLLRRSPLLPDESLPSLVARLAWLNGYDPPTLLDRFCLAEVPPHLSRGTVDCWPPAVTFPRLAALTTIDVGDLYHASAHRFAPILTLPVTTHPNELGAQDEGVPVLDGTVILAHVRPALAAQFCPACLNEMVYHRLSWTPYAVAACLEHRCLLVQQCPGCHRPVTLAMVTVARCHSCGADLRTAGAQDLSGDTWVLQAQELIHGWLGVAPVPDGAADALPDSRPAVCYGVLDVIRRLVMRSSPTWDYWHTINGDATVAQRGLLESTPAQIASVYATAMKGLRGWPEALSSFLHAYRSAGRGGQGQVEGGEEYDNGRVFLWLMAHWLHPAYGHVREGLHDYLSTECRLWAWGDGGRATILECFHELCANAATSSPDVVSRVGSGS